MITASQCLLFLKLLQRFEMLIGALAKKFCIAKAYGKNIPQQSAINCKVGEAVPVSALPLLI